jgi:hypothetical protein
MQQWLAAGKNDLTHSKPHNRCALALEIYQVKLFAAFPLPDVTHQAPAVAVLMDIQDKDWQTHNRLTLRLDTVFCPS